MGLCVHCRAPAGLFRSEHAACTARKASGWGGMVEAVLESLRDESSRSTLRDRLHAMAVESFNDPGAVDEVYLQAWERAVEAALEDGVLDEDEEASLASFRSFTGLGQGQLDRKGALMRVVRSGVLRDMLKGQLPDQHRFDANLPFNFQKSERLLWVFPDTEYLEERIRREYVGGYSGASIRVARGLYWRVGGFRGHPIESVSRVSVGLGLFGVTTEHIYFAGPSKSLRIRHDKIVSIEPFDDGVGIHRDAQTAKPQIFRTGDGWFTYNLLMNINHLS